MRNAQAPRHRPHEVEEATGALTLTRKCFRHLALDYVLQVSCRVFGGRLLPCLCSQGAGVWRGSSGLRTAEMPDLGKGHWGGGVPRPKPRPRGRDGLGTSPGFELRGRGLEDLLGAGLGGAWSRGENSWLHAWEAPKVLNWGRTLGPWEDGTDKTWRSQRCAGGLGATSSPSGRCGQVQALARLGPDSLHLLPPPHRSTSFRPRRSSRFWIL